MYTIQPYNQQKQLFNVAHGIDAGGRATNIQTATDWGMCQVHPEWSALRCIAAVVVGRVGVWIGSKNGRRRRSSCNFALPAVGANLVPYLKNLEQNEKNSYSAFLTSVGWTKYSRMTNAVTTTRRPSLVKKYL